MNERELEQPVRETPFGRQCPCVLIIGQTPDGTPVLSTCSASTFNPDQPMCAACTEAGHEDQPRVPYVEVIAARREGREIR